MPTDNETITELYLKMNEPLIEEDVTREVRRDPNNNSMVDVDGVKKDITDWLYEITEGGNALLTIWTRRRRDKIDKLTKAIVAKAGEELVLNCKLGPCDKDVSGVGSPLGTPKERYKKYDLITVCANRDGEWSTRHLNVTDVFKIKAAGVIYNVI